VGRAAAVVAAADRASAVIIKLITSSDIPMSMERPRNVRTSQRAASARPYRAIRLPFIHWKPCCRPAGGQHQAHHGDAQVISQNDQLPSVHDTAFHGPDARPDIDESADAQTTKVRLTVSANAR